MLQKFLSHHFGCRRPAAHSNPTAAARLAEPGQQVGAGLLAAAAGFAADAAVLMHARVSLTFVAAAPTSS